jgi:PAS domain-containing protein
MIGTTRKIDDRKKLELELKESEKKYRIVTENTNDLV